MRIAICEDEKVFQDIVLEYLTPYLLKMNDITVQVFSNGQDLLAHHFEEHKFDLIFLDIELPVMSGVEVAQSIRESDTSVILIFITGHTQYVRNAFSINAFQYLTKPLSQEVFNEEFERALEHYNKMKFLYKINCRKVTKYFEIRDILYIETYDRHLRLVTQDGKYEYKGKISDEEIKLENYGFIRCHQGYLVNMRHIVRPVDGCFKLTNNENIPISRKMKNEVMSKYNKFLARCCL